MATLFLGLVLWLHASAAHEALPSPDALRCHDVATEVHLMGADAITKVTIPSGWCYEETDSAGVNVQPSGTRGVTLNLDWYHPHRDAVYDDFDSRIKEEVRFIRETNSDIQIRRFTQAGMPAFEVRARERNGRHLVYTYIGFRRRGELGHLFVAILDEPSTVSHRHLDTYRAIVRSIRITTE
jgi:hypothetical protein